MLDEQNSPSPIAEIRVLEIVGGFLMFFGALLLIGIACAETTSDRVTNLVSALILLTVGIGMFWRGVVRHKRPWLMPVVLFGILAVVAAVAAFSIAHLIPKEKEEPAAVEQAQEEEPQQLEPPGDQPFFVKSLERIGSAMRGAVERISLSWVRLFTVIALVLIAAVVCFVQRQTVFEGVVDRRWWRDLRLWTLVVVATQVVIYLLLGT
jgi:hypothetical protein